MSDVVVQAPGALRKPLALRGAVLLAFGAALAIAGIVVWKTHASYHFAAVQPGVLYRDGFRSPEQFAATLDRVHPKTVVSLIDDRELSDPAKPQLAAEGRLCSARGIALDRIPVTLGGWPAGADIQRFLAIVADPQNRPVLVHCAQGVRRTGMFVAAYQESVLGYDKAKAKSAVLGFGHGKDTVEQIDRFIDRYDPKAQTVPADLGKGIE